VWVFCPLKISISFGSNSGNVPFDLSTNSLLKASNWVRRGCPTRGHRSGSRYAELLEAEATNRELERELADVRDDETIPVTVLEMDSDVLGAEIPLLEEVNASKQLDGLVAQVEDRSIRLVVPLEDLLQA